MTNTYYAADIELQDFRRYRKENLVGRGFTVVISGIPDAYMWRLANGDYEGLQTSPSGKQLPFRVTMSGDTAVCFGDA